jgi:hypothetical protein
LKILFDFEFWINRHENETTCQKQIKKTFILHLAKIETDIRIQSNSGTINYILKMIKESWCEFWVETQESKFASEQFFLSISPILGLQI